MRFVIYEAHGLEVENEARVLGCETPRWDDLIDERCGEWASRAKLDECLAEFLIERWI
jgi:hypothetical protein